MSGDLTKRVRQTNLLELYHTGPRGKTFVAGWRPSWIAVGLGRSRHRRRRQPAMEFLFGFAVALEDSSLRRLQWDRNKGGYVPFDVPAYGQQVQISGLLSDLWASGFRTA